MTSKEEEFQNNQHIKTYPIKEVSVQDIVFPPMNANEMNAEQFDALVDSIREHGFVENVVLLPISIMGEEFMKVHPDKKYVTRSGEHRVRAAAVINEMAKVPAVIIPEEDLGDLWTEMAYTVKMNLLKGDQNLQKLSVIYHEIREQVGHAQAVDAMGITSDKQFQRLIAKTKRRLPKEMRKKFKQEEAKIENARDLNAVVRMIFSQSSDDQKYGFLVFSANGQVHTMIVLNQRLEMILDHILDYCRQHDLDARHVIANAIVTGWESEQEE